MAIALAAWLANAIVFNGPISENEEAYYAVAASAMVRTGEWVVPRYNGVPRLNKPPLTYWAAASSAALFGLSERSLRVPSVLATALTAWFLFVLAQFYVTRQTATAALALYSGSAGPLLHARWLFPDPIFTMFVTGSMVVVARTGRRPTQLTEGVVLGLLLGGAFLTKGPTCLLWVVLFGLVDRALAPGQRKSPLRLWVTAVCVLLLLVIPYYVALGRMGYSQSLYRFLMVEHFDRFRGEFGSAPIYYYAVPLVVFMLPWSALVPVAWIGRARAESASQSGVRVFAYWALLALIVLSCSAGKLARYILPACPALAVLAAHIWMTASAARQVVSVALVAPVVAWLVLGANNTLGFRSQTLAMGGIFVVVGTVACYSRQHPSSTGLACAFGICLLTNIGIDCYEGTPSGNAPVIRAAAMLTDQTSADATVILHDMFSLNMPYYIQRNFRHLWVAGDVLTALRASPCAAALVSDRALRTMSRQDNRLREVARVSWSRTNDWPWKHSAPDTSAVLVVVGGGCVAQ